jgi:hypothetical protein
MGKNINAYEISVGILEGKRPLGRGGFIWEDNITSKMDLKEIECEVVDGGEMWSLANIVVERQVVL